MQEVLQRNNVNVFGKGSKPIVFAHGFGCDQSMWRYVVPGFEDRYQIVLLDLVGAGNSDLSAYNREKYDSLEGHAEDIVEVCQALDLKEVIFVGHSVSAMIGVLADVKKPGLFSNLILIGPSPRYINEEDYYGGFDKKDIGELLKTMDANYLGWSASLAPAIMGNSDKPELGEELTDSFCRTDPSIAKHFAKITFLSDNRSDLDKVHAASLILQCSDDIIAPESVGRFVHQRIPNSTFIQLKATGHCPHISAPDETIQAIMHFLHQ